MMDDIELDIVAEGKRPFTNKERVWAISQHEFLSEYTTSDNPRELDDKALAKEVKNATWDYIRCTM